MATGKLPETGKITLEKIEEDRWRFLADKGINEIRISAELERSPGYKVKVNLVIEKIILPGKRSESFNFVFDPIIGIEFSRGVTRLKEFFNDLMNQDCWILIGYIDGKNHGPIIINHYMRLKLSIYTQKLITETKDAKNSFSLINCLN